MDEVRSEIDSELPYKVMSNLACEADDIIAILCKHYHKAGKILIISSDKDFIQLHKYHNVSQWSPLSKTFLTVPNPNDFKVNLILKGDRSDGVPNVLSPDDTFVANQRQRKLTKKKLDEWISADNLEAVLEGEHFRNFKRNQKMIDLDYVPEMVEINIITHYNKDHFTGRNKMLNYFIKHRLRELTESIQEF
jgi:5'-3' exonuclease